MSVHEHISGTAGPIVTIFCRSPVVVARSFCGRIAIRYALPVLWMTSRFVVVGRMAMRGERRCDIEAESDVYECFVVFALQVIGSLASRLY